MAYSANFAGGSGKPMPPALYLQVTTSGAFRENH
jgi:hypothetical protein